MTTNNKDAADLFAAEGERAAEVLEGLKAEARDALDLALSGAPEDSGRERFRYAREQVFPLIARIGDVGERAAAADDVAEALGLRRTDLRRAFRDFEEERRARERDDGEADEGGDDNDDDLAPEPGTERHGRATALLADPDILGRLVADAERLGHVGERTAKQLAFICAVSAMAGHPVQPSTHAESSAGKNFLWDTVLSFLPPEMVIKRSAISDKALFRTQADLRGRVLYLQEVAGSEGADFAIRVMQSAQRLEYEATEKMPDGSFQTVVYEKEGPVVVVQTTTAIRLFHENDTRVFPVYLDESAEQTRRIVESVLLRAETGGAPAEEREGMLEAWHDALRLLGPAEVVVPYARRIEVPSHRVRVRRDVNRLLDVIRVVAWLHQRGRGRDGLGRVLATEEDFRVALALVSDSLGRAWRSLSPAEEAVMEAVRALPEANRRNGFQRKDLVVEGYDKRRVQDALKALTETGHLDSDRRGGPGGYRYSVPGGDPEGAGMGVSLSPTHGVDDADEGGEGDGGGSAAEGEVDVEEDPSRGPRGSAREGGRAVETAVPSEEGAIARARGDTGEEEESVDVGADRGSAEDVDYLRELTELGWYRAQSVFPEAEPLDGGGRSSGEDPVARVLRHEVGIYRTRGPEEETPHAYLTPTALTAEDVLAKAPRRDDDGGGVEGWPSTAEEMAARLRRVIPELQARPRLFWDPGYSDFLYHNDVPGPRDPDKACREARLHAEKWRKQDSDEEAWALVALREGWAPPDRDIEFAVWWRATGQSRILDISPDDNGDDEFRF